MSQFPARARRRARSINNTARVFGVLLGVGAVMLVTRLATADIPDGNLIHVCVNSNLNSVKFIDTSKGDTCLTSETELTWFGVSGSGAQGIPGESGPTGPTGAAGA